jgi:hypothetical protein
MNRTLAIVFLLAAVFCAPVDAQEPCPDKPCPHGITKIGDCLDKNWKNLDDD